LPDVVDQQTRSRMMSGIRGRNTKPELLIRRGLFARGFRYRLHAAGLPGKPDIVLPRYHAVIFVNGCFWHGHDCHLFRMPSTRPEFWKKKIARNVERDREACQLLTDAGWRPFVVWECALKGRTRLDPDEVMRRIAGWLRGKEPVGEIRGRHERANRVRVRAVRQRR
jgi:DNA mismatch endonuclease, patch repair protein